MWCPECKSHQDGKFCKSCGAPTIPYNLPCPHGCPQQIDVWSKFCGGCGKPVQKYVKDWIEKKKIKAKGGEQVCNKQ